MHPTSAMEAGYWLDGGTDGEGLLDVWNTADGGSLVQLIGGKVVVL